VAWSLVSLTIWSNTWEFTRKTNHTSVHCVMKTSAHQMTWRTIVTTIDLTSALTAGNWLKQSAICSVILTLTLEQSRTHVLTVQSVFHGVAAWSHICWDHTMKVLGSHVICARRSSVTVVTLKDICFVVMNVWSRTFAANVQCVSIHRMNCDFINQCTRTSYDSAVVHVVKFSDVNRPLCCTSVNVLMSWDFLLSNVHWYIDKRETENRISVESDIKRHVTGRAVTVNTTSSMLELLGLWHHSTHDNVYMMMTNLLVCVYLYICSLVQVLSKLSILALWLCVIQ